MQYSLLSNCTQMPASVWFFSYRASKWRASDISKQLSHQVLHNSRELYVKSEWSGINQHIYSYYANRLKPSFKALLSFFTLLPPKASRRRKNGEGDDVIGKLIKWLSLLFQLRVARPRETEMIRKKSSVVNSPCAIHKVGIKMWWLDSRLIFKRHFTEEQKFNSSSTFLW